MQRIDDSNLTRISYTDGWRQKTGTTAYFNLTNHVTDVTDSQAVFRFLGTYVEVHGQLGFAAGQHADFQKLVFTIDGGQRYTYQPTTRDKGPIQFNVSSFPLEAREHELVIRCTNDTRAIWLDYIDYLPVETDSDAKAAAGSLSKGALAGAVVGIVGFVALSVGMVVWLWRRRKKLLQRGRDAVTPFEYSIPSGMMGSDPRGSNASSRTILHQKSSLPQAPTPSIPMPSPQGSPPPYPGV